MRNARRYRNRRKNRVSKRRAKRGSNRVTKRGVNLTHMGHNKVLPPSMTITQQYALQGYVPSGAYASGYFDIYANVSADSLDTPLDFTQANNRTGVLVQSGAIGQNSQYITKLLGPDAVYCTSRVLNSKITVACNPLSLADTCYLTIVPYTNKSADAPPTNDASINYVPGAKYKLCCSNYASMKQNQLQYSQSAAKFFGVPSNTIMSEDDYRADNGSTFVSQPVNIAFWRVQWATAQASNLASNLVFRINLSQTSRLETLNPEKLN